MTMSHELFQALARRGRLERSSREANVGGGSNEVGHIEPVTTSDYVRQHGEVGDFRRWGRRQPRPRR